MPVQVIFIFHRKHKIFHRDIIYPPSGYQCLVFAPKVGIA